MINVAVDTNVLVWDAVMLPSEDFHEGFFWNGRHLLLEALLNKS